MMSVSSEKESLICAGEERKYRVIDDNVISQVIILFPEVLLSKVLELVRAVLRGITVDLQ